MTKSFYELLTEQVGHEFAASHQYLAMAIWLDGEDLPQLAGPLTADRGVGAVQPSRHPSSTCGIPD